MTLDDTLIFTPEGEQRTCREVVESRGGWQNVSAEEATQLSMAGCGPAFQVEPVSYRYEEPMINFDDFVAGSMSGGFPESVTGTGPAENLSGYFAQVLPMAYRALDAALTDQGPLGPIVPINPQTGSVERPQYQVSVHPGAACWDKPRKNGMPNSRVRVKLQRQPDGTFAVVRYCAPKKMNPLNPRALSRAARRIGSFQRIAANIEKIVQKACRTGLGRGRRRSSVPRLPANCRTRC